MNETGLIVLLFVVAVLTAALVWWAMRRSRPSPSHTPQKPVESVLQTMFGTLLPTARLLCIEGPARGQKFEIRGKQICIGRNPSSDIFIDDPLVSWDHALLTYDVKLKKYLLYDQDSTNGTWINNQRIAQRPVNLDIDQIRIGPAVFIIRQSEDPLPTPTPLPLQTSALTTQASVYPIKDYELLEELGRGGSSIVYKAHSRRDKQIVAIKVLTQADPYLLTKFKSEADVIPRMLRHPNILQVYGSGEIPRTRQLYLVMEYIQGGTLRDLLRPGVPLPLNQIVLIAGQVCDALQYAHRKGVYHRDLKPENIFFADAQLIKLGDFGIARLAQSVTRTSSGYLLGTPLYMSYEQARGISDIDERSDLYALGVVLYEMVTGYPPFQADNPLAVVEKHLKEWPSPPRQIVPQIPESIEMAIMRALEKDRSRRFRNAEKMARALGYTMSMHGESPLDVREVSRPSAASDSKKGLQLMRNDRSVLPLTSQGLHLGRATLDTKDENISRKHARIIYREGVYWLEDCNSTNGTFVNGQRIFSPHPLKAGDCIQLGNSVVNVVAR